MENFRGIAQIVRSVSKSATKKENKGVFGISTFGAIVFGLHLSDIHLDNFWVKACASVITIVFAPPLSAFMKDIYDIKIKPKIFKDKHKY